MENIHQLVCILEVQVLIIVGIRQVLGDVHASKVLHLLFFLLDSVVNFLSLLFTDVRVETIQEEFVFAQILQGFSL